MKNQTLKISFCAVLIALSTITMMLTGIISIGTYALPAIAGLFTIPVLIHINKKYAFATYISTSILSALLAADKEAVIIFIMFFGYYPILKFTLKSIKNNIIKLLLKLLIFNISVIITYEFALNILMLPKDSFVIFGVSLPIVLLVMGNVIFLLYDYALTLQIKTYIIKIKPKIEAYIKIKK